jgi:general secretion pathway protein E
VISKAYAERYRILPVAVNKIELIVATSEPFIRSWADELENILHLRVKLVFSEPGRHQALPRRVLQPGRSRSAAPPIRRSRTTRSRPTSSSWSSSGQKGALDANDRHIIHIVDWLWQFAFEQRASDIHLEPRRENGVVRFRIDGVLHQAYQIRRR